MSEKISNGFTGAIFILILFIGGIYFLINMAEESNIQREKEIKEVFEKGLIFEQHKFNLKEMSTDKEMSGKFKGSFLLIGGSVYGQIGENNYINIVYFDDDLVLDDTINVYRVTKFNMENIEIVTIPKNETPYYTYVKNGHVWKCIDDCSYHVSGGTPRLHLPEGWAILNNN